MEKPIIQSQQTEITIHRVAPMLFMVTAAISQS